MKTEKLRRTQRRGPALSAIALLVLTLGAANAAETQDYRRGADPDWPCFQRLMPTLGAAALWSGPSLAAAGDWRADPAVVALVERITPRKVAAADGEAAIAAFADAPERAAEDKAIALTRAFAGLLELTNNERGQIIARIKELGARQRGLANIASQAQEELSAIPVGATGDAAAKRNDLQQRFLYVTQAFDGAQKTMRYVCESPVELEARLGSYARALQARLPGAAAGGAKDATP